MAIMDAGPQQAWIAAFDKWDLAQRRYDAAGRIGNATLTSYLRQTLERAASEYNAAVKAINNA